MAKIVVGVTGSVAAVRVPELVRELRRAGHEVECVMTKAATRIIRASVLRWASGEKVVCRLSGGVEHVRLLGLDGEADALLICPCTSNTISKIASGIDDTTVTTMAATALGSGRKIIVVPAMHQSMYQNPFVAENVDKLKGAGIMIVEPRIQEGKAKIACRDDIVMAVEKALQ